MSAAKENGERQSRSPIPADNIRTPSSIPGWSLGLLGFGFAPLLGVFFLNRWKLPEYQFFPQALAGAGVLAWDRLREVPRPMVGGHPPLSGALLLFAFMALSLAVFIWSPWLAIVAALPAGIAVLWRTGGAPLLRKMGPALMMVLTVIPPPIGLDVRLGLFLREVATTLSSRALDVLGIVHCVTGNVIELPGQKLLVEEACSGINSVLFVTAFSLFYLFWRRRSSWCFLVCLPAALAFVVMGNVARISLGAWLRYYYRIDILNGWQHETESIVLVAVYVLLVVSLEALFPRGKCVAAKSPPPRGFTQPASGLSPLLFRTACCLFAVLGVISSFKAWEISKATAEPLRAANSTLASRATFSLPDRIGDWSRSETGPPKVSKIETLGLSSAVWNYQRPGMQAVIAFDYPIWSYHDVADCYLRNGWLIQRKDIVVPKNGAPARYQLAMKKEPGIQASLWFATINEKGEWIDQATVKHDFISRLGLPESRQETTYRVQMLLVGDKTPDAVSFEAANQLFEGAAAILLREMLQQVRR